MPATVAGRVQVALLVALAGVCWGAMAPVSKYIFTVDGSHFDGIGLSVARAVWSLSISLVIAALLWRRVFGGATLRRDLWRFAGLALLVGPGLNMLYVIATQLTSSAHVVLLYGCTPLATAVAEGIAFKRGLDGQRKIALALGFAGIVALAFGHAGGRSSPLGDAVAVAWVLVYAAYALAARSLSERYSAAAITVLGWGGGALIVVAIGVPLHALGAVAHSFDRPDVTLGLIGVLVIGGAFVAPAAHATSVRSVNVSVVTAGNQYVAIATGLVLSFALLHERLTPIALVGGALLVASLTLTLAPSLHRRARPTARPA